MTVKEFAAFTSLSPSKIRAEIRAGNLQANKVEKTVVDGVTTQAHYEITEDPAAWLKRRNPTPQENQDQQTTPNQENREKSPQPHQKSQQEQETQETKISPVAVAVGVGLALLLVVGLLYVESRPNY